MSETFSMILTTLGLAEIADAIANSTQVTLTDFSVGDSSGSYYAPSAGQTSLVNEQYRAALTTISQDPSNSNWVVVEGTVPADDVGGWYVREGGIWSSTGNLFAVGKLPETFKPLLTAGAGKDLYIKAIMEVSNASVITLLVDPNVAIATKNYVDLFANYIKYKLSDCVVCPTYAYPAGDSGVAANPYGVPLSSLKPAASIERLYTYVTKTEPDGRVLSNDIRVFSDNQRGASIGVRMVSDLSQFPDYVSGRSAVSINDHGLLYCTFKGTGLNVLFIGYDPIEQIEFSIDGGAFASKPSETQAVGLNLSELPFICINIVSNLAYGDHTIRFRATAGSGRFAIILGFDILCDYDSVRVPSGDYFVNGKYLQNTLGADITPSAIGTNNHRRDLIVAGEDLLIHFVAGTTVDTPKYYGEANFDTERAKEEIKRIYNVRDFVLAPRFVSNYIFAHVLADASTGLQSDTRIASSGTSTPDGIQVVTSGYSGSYEKSIKFNPYALGQDVNLIFNFVGTGCDAFMFIPNTTETNIVVNIYVDGTLKATLDETNDTSEHTIYKLCSGLPYGSHSIRLEAKHSGGDQATGSWNLHLIGFTVYWAKTATLPDNHLALGCANLIPSDGWRYHAPDRGIKYLGSLWELKPSDEAEITDRLFGYEIETASGDNTTSSAGFTFVGVGVIWYGESGNNDGKVEVYLDGTLLTTSHPNWASLTVTSAMDIAFDTGTGIVDCYEAGSALVAEREGIKITGLTPGLHSIKLVGAGKNASSSDYQISVHGFSVLPTTIDLDNEHNWNYVTNNVGRNCSILKRDPRIAELQIEKQDRHHSLDSVIDEAVLETGKSYVEFKEDSGIDVGGTQAFQFLTKKVNIPIIFRNTHSLTAVSSSTVVSVTRNGFILKITGTTATPGTYQDDWIAIAQ